MGRDTGDTRELFVLFSVSPEENSFVCFSFLLGVTMDTWTLKAKFLSGVRSQKIKPTPSIFTMMMTMVMAMTPSGSVNPRHRHAKEYPHSKGRRGGLWCSTSNNSSDKIPPIETVPPSQFDDMSKEELKRELAASFEIRAAMAAKLELVEDQLRATVSEVCKILALKRETEFELERMKEKYEPSRESS